MTSTSFRRHVKAPRHVVYRALIDPDAVSVWKAPHGMTCRVHELDAREGGRFRVSLTRDAATQAGETSTQTDTYDGRFLRLVPNLQVVECCELETGDPSMAGETTITITLGDAEGGTDLHGVHEAPRPGVSSEDDVRAWEQALSRLAALVESGWGR